jgi:PhnB protein
MAELPNIDQLDDAVSAVVELDQPDPGIDEQVAELVAVARDLVWLPRESFRTQLRAQLTGRDSMSSPVQKLEEPTVQKVSLYMTVVNASDAIEFYKTAFGATELFRLAEPSGKIGHAEFQIGNAVIMISDEYPDYNALSPQTLGGTSVKIHLDVTDVDAFADRALRAGAKLVRPIEDQFYGARSGHLADPFGYTWVVSTHLKDVPADELQKEFDKFTESESATVESDQPGQEPKIFREGFHTVTPYFTVHRPTELIDFVTQAFGANEKFRAPGSAGGMHAEVQIGDSMVMIGGAAHIEPMPAAIHLYVPDIDEAYKRAIAAGGTSLMEPADQPYGERSGGVEDTQGNRWYIATPFVPLGQIAADLHTVTVYFHPIGAQKFIDFVTNAFGGKELMRHADDKMILHAKVQIGDSVIELGEARYPEQPLPTAIYLYVEDVDSMYEQALRAGGVSLLEPTDQPYGDRNAWVKDPFDNVWYLASPVK